MLILIYEHLLIVLTALGLRCRVQACSTCSGFSWRRAQAPQCVGFMSGGSRAEPVGPSRAGGLLTTDHQGSQSRRTVLLTEQPHGTSWSSRRTALRSGQTPSAAASNSPGAASGGTHLRVLLLFSFLPRGCAVWEGLLPSVWTEQHRYPEAFPCGEVFSNLGSLSPETADTPRPLHCRQEMALPRSPRHLSHKPRFFVRSFVCFLLSHPWQPLVHKLS